MRLNQFKVMVPIAVLVACLSCAKANVDDSPARPADPEKQNGLDEHPEASPPTQSTTNPTDVPTPGTAPNPAPVPNTGVATLTELFAKLSPNHSGPNHPSYYSTSGQMTGNMPGFGAIDVAAEIAVYFSGSGADRVFHVAIHSAVVDHVEYIIDTYNNWTTIDGTSLGVFCWNESNQTRTVSVGTISATTLDLNNPLISKTGGRDFTWCADSKPDTSPSGYTIELLDNNRIKFKKSGTGIYRYIYPNPSVSNPGTVVEAIFDMSSGIRN